MPTAQRDSIHSRHRLAASPAWLTALAILLCTGCGNSEPPKLSRPVKRPPALTTEEPTQSTTTQGATETTTSAQQEAELAATSPTQPNTTTPEAPSSAEDASQPAQTPFLEPNVVGIDGEPAPTSEADSRKKLPSTYSGDGSTREGSLQSPMEAFRVPPPEHTPAMVDIPAKVRRYAEKLVTRYDLDGNGTLEPVEWLQMRGDPRNDDLNGDEVLTSEELAIRIAVYGHRRFIRLMPGRRMNEPVALAEATPENVSQTTAAEDEAAAIAAEREKLLRSRQFYVRASRMPSGLPEWFVEGDTNGDGQMSMAEFSAKWSSTELDRFDTYDHDHDGMITAQECARGELVQQQLENAAATSANQPATEPLR